MSQIWFFFMYDSNIFQANKIRYWLKNKSRNEILKEGLCDELWGTIRNKARKANILIINSGENAQEDRSLE